MWDMYTNKFLYIPVIDKDLLKAFKHFFPYFSYLLHFVVFSSDIPIKERL